MKRIQMINNVTPERNPPIHGRIHETQSNLSSGVLKEKSSAKGKQAEIS